MKRGILETIIRVRSEGNRMVRKLIRNQSLATVAGSTPVPSALMITAKFTDGGRSYS